MNHNPLKHSALPVWIIASLTTIALLGAPQASNTRASANQQVVLRFFRDILDGGGVNLADEVFHADCIIHRPEGDLKGIGALRSFVQARRALYSTFATEVHEVLESGDRVIVRLSHRGIGRGSYRFRVGTYDISGKAVAWDAVAIFRMKQGRIAEEWVSRDELGMLLTSGILPGVTVRYPTMLDMTFPEFEAATAKTDIALLPIGAIEEHSSHLPLGTDAMNATAQVFRVQEYLHRAGFETIIGPPLNIGITNEASDVARDGTYVYPGSLTISKSTFVALYLDVLRSLRDNGLRRAFLYSGHLGTRQVEAVVQTVEEANRRIEGMTVYAAIDSEKLESMKLAAREHILSVDKLRNFEMVAQLLGRGSELPRTTHADGAETSWTLHFYPDAVRSGYERFPPAPSSIFLEVLRSGDRSKNPSGSGGFPFDKASADVGKRLVDYKTSRIAEAILQVLRAQ